MLAKALYRSATTLSAPFVDHLLARRLDRGKEEAARIQERHGVATAQRPAGPVVWIHAASNGEAMSALPLIERLLVRDPSGHVLVTTGTVTSAKLLADRMPPAAIHQYVPIDRPAWVRAFLDYWDPDVGIWVESEFWPNLIWEMRARGKPMALVNGRISAKSYRRWRKLSSLAKDLLGNFQPCLAQTESEAARLRDIGAPGAESVGNLKLSADPLPVDEAALALLKRKLADRPVWLAASTHPGEEMILAEAHRLLRTELPELLTIIVPRHPQRGDEVAKDLRAIGYRLSQRSLGETPALEDDFYLADTLGELGLFYRLCPVSFIGGSLVDQHGGHNPIEAALLGSVPLFGRDMANFAAIAQDLVDQGGGLQVQTPQAISAAALRLLDVTSRRERMADAALTTARRGASAIDRVIGRLAPILPPPPASGET